MAIARNPTTRGPPAAHRARHRPEDIQIRIRRSASGRKRRQASSANRRDTLIGPPSLNTLIGAAADQRLGMTGQQIRQHADRPGGV